jgi:hypothetical protein
MLTNYITVYEQSFLGIGMSMWCIIALGFICFILIMALLTIFGKLGPTQGYLYAAFSKTDEKNIAILFQNHSITIKKLQYFSGVFDRLGLTWIAKKPEQHRFGECSAELVADFWGLTMDPKVNAATLEFINAWNADLEYELFAESDYAWLPKLSDRHPIVDFDSLYAAIEKCPPDSDIRIRAFTYVPMYTLQKYYPKNLTASDLTGYNEAMKKVTEEKAASPASSLLPLICLVGGLLLGLGIMFLVK